MPETFFAATEPARGVLQLTGDDRIDFLQGLVSNDMRKVSETHGIWAALLTAQGKYLHDFFIVADDDSILIDVEAERLDDLRRRLSMYKLRAKVVIDDVSAKYGVWLGWGGTAGEPGDVEQVGNGIILTDPRLKALGIRAILPQATATATLEAHGYVAAEWAAWDRLRLSHGVPDGSRDMELEKAILLENGFDELSGVSWDKGCYMGQELTARTKYRGLVKKRLMPVRLDGPLPAAGALVTRPDGSEAGEIRSGRDGLALALIRLDAADLPLAVEGVAIHPSKPDWALW